MHAYERGGEASGKMDGHIDGVEQFCILLDIQRADMLVECAKTFMWEKARTFGTQHADVDVAIGAGGTGLAAGDFDGELDRLRAGRALVVVLVFLILLLLLVRLLAFLGLVRRMRCTAGGTVTNEADATSGEGWRDEDTRVRTCRGALERKLDLLAIALETEAFLDRRWRRRMRRRRERSAMSREGEAVSRRARTFECIDTARDVVVKE